MALFIGKRMAFLVVMLFGLLIITFLISHVAPGDPASLAAGPDAPPEMVEHIRHEFGLDRPLPVQLGLYVMGILHGNLGQSVRTGHSVLQDLGDFFPATFELVTVSMLGSLWNIFSTPAVSVVINSQAVGTSVTETYRSRFIFTSTLVHRSSAMPASIWLPTPKSCHSVLMPPSGSITPWYRK